MNHYERYLRELGKKESIEVSQSVCKITNEIIEKYIGKFTHTSRVVGLLMGHVQSGKTGLMLGVLAAAADRGFQIIIILTTDSNLLQHQTFERAHHLLNSGFCICNETEHHRLSRPKMTDPFIIIIKKNSKTLNKWKKELQASQIYRGRSMLIIDDEGDAASLNTMVNTQKVSTVKKTISDIWKLTTSSIYLQVTATPHALFLQDEESGSKPEFIQFFEPGPGYIGGDFFFGAERPDDGCPARPIRITEENELPEIIENEIPIHGGLLSALSSFLISASYIVKFNPMQPCNFLVHPSVGVDDQDRTAKCIGEALNSFVQNISEPKEVDNLKDSLYKAWVDLKKTKPEIFEFDMCFSGVVHILENGKIDVATMNSKSKSAINYGKGINIIVGGNILSRGLTIPNLLTVYYCRKAKSPQADTLLQHCRMFGYDRDSGLIRVFLPPSLFQLFVALNSEYNLLIEHVKSGEFKKYHVINSENIKPTRSNVINSEKIRYFYGGVNYFPTLPLPDHTDEIDKILTRYPKDKNYDIVEPSVLLSVLKLCKVEDASYVQPSFFASAINSFLKSQTPIEGVLIVRRERKITKGTGTLLSPNDQSTGNKFNDKIVLTMYRLADSDSLGWGGSPIWIPNIKLPKKYILRTLKE